MTHRFEPAAPAADPLPDATPGALTDAELLSALLGPRPGPRARRRAERLIERIGWDNLLAAETADSWAAWLTPGQSRRLGAALELARRIAGSEGAISTVLRSPREVYDATADLRHHRREHFIGLYLNTRSRLLAREEISVGCLNASIVHPREVFEPALRHAAASLIVVHNHPSGEPEPSRDDLAITRRLAQAGDILGITLVDHVIVARGGYASLKDLGHL